MASWESTEVNFTDHFFIDMIMFLFHLVVGPSRLQV